jgi:hypothetical protein
VLVSARMSERLSFSSTKYGPSVFAGMSTHEVVAAWASASRPSVSSSRCGRTWARIAAAPTAPAAPNAWRRVVDLVGMLVSGVMAGDAPL